MSAPATHAGPPDPAPIGEPKGIPSVDWWTTSHCNLACNFCYGPAPKKDPIELRPAILEALARSSAEKVTFCGGEPLLLKRIGQYAETLHQHGKGTVLNTNGLLLRRCIDKGLSLEVFTVVGISIEGSTPEVHHAMRGPGADLYEAVDAARLVLKEPGVTLKLATVVSRVNQDDLPALARFVRDLGPDIWRLYQYSSRGEQNFSQDLHTLPKAEFEFLAWKAGKLAAPVSTVPSTEEETEGCLIVDTLGNVLTPFRDHYVPHGNLLRQPLDRIWAKIPKKSTIISNKRWLSVLEQRQAERTASMR